jgi:hypothetical protein
MAVAIIIEFEAEGLDPEALYDKVNTVLDIDVETGRNMPEGMLVHVPVVIDQEHFMVFEVWASGEDHERFMAEKLRPAFAEVGVPTPSKVTAGNPLQVFHAH